MQAAVRIRFSVRRRKFHVHKGVSISASLIIHTDRRPCGACKKRNMHCVESTCKTGLMEDSKFASCTREKHHVHLEESVSSATASYSEGEPFGFPPCMSSR